MPLAMLLHDLVESRVLAEFVVRALVVLGSVNTCVVWMSESGERGALNSGIGLKS